ncbi:MAG: crossover junction endodeoxyribonuclease RuvC [Ignavibacteria bacterium]|nr:crossover junction endodeoxyribonuclease RuvC [Ignavibacteria bacterium]
MIILGIDPGSIVTGVGLIEFAGNYLKLIDFDAFELNTKKPVVDRLKLLYDLCIIKINKFRPEHLSIETAFYSKNIQSTLKLGQARGVAIISALNSGLEIFEYSPREIKRSVTGNGAATKQDVKYYIRRMLKFKEEPKYMDSYDALAAAICHFHSISGNILLYKGGMKKNSKKMWLNYVNQNPGKILNN